jgi:hypothetical protein
MIMMEMRDGRKTFSFICGILASSRVLMSSVLSVPEIGMMPQADGSERVPAQCTGPVMANIIRMKQLYTAVPSFASSFTSLDFRVPGQQDVYFTIVHSASNIGL